MAVREFDVQGTITIPAGGARNLRFDGPYGGDWFIRRAIFARDGAGTGETVSVFVGSVDNAGVRDSTVAGATPAVADEASPIRVPTSTPFFARVEGGTSGDVWTVTMQMSADETAGEGAEDWGGYGAPDSLLYETGFANQNRIPAGRR